MVRGLFAFGKKRNWCEIRVKYELEDRYLTSYVIAKFGIHVSLVDAWVFGKVDGYLKSGMDEN